MNYELLKEFLSIYAFQPATALWRAIEIDALLNCDYFPQDGKLLDLGCGDGKLTEIILSNIDYEGEIIGVDPDDLEIEQARQTGIYDSLHTVPGNDIPVTDEVFDTVLSNSVLEHIPELESVIREISRVMKQDAISIFTVPIPSFKHCLSGPLLPNQSREKYLADLDKRLAHYNYLNEDDSRNLLESNNIQLVLFETYLSCSETRRWETLSRWTGGIFYSLFGKKKHPIHIQRTLGMRQTQNRVRLPKFLCALIARIITPRLSNSGEKSCALVVGRKYAVKS